MIGMLQQHVKAFALAALAIWSGCALANPSGPTVVNGTATFSQPDANTLNVTNSHNAIINWQGFDIGRGQTTNFIQPGRYSAVMNRVIGNNPSQIYGNLNSNGKVFLINQHGLLIGPGGRVNTAGFYGSTLNITNEDFLKGNLKFEGGGFGGIQNHGYIHAGPGGNVVLLAPDIENGGVIEVDSGNVILAAGESIRITSLNDASIEFDLQAPDNGVVNLGAIIAKQGAARLFAGNLKHSGSINATGIVQNADGSISLVAQQDIEVAAAASIVADGETGGGIRIQSHHGDVLFSGTASARGETGKGGRIEILGDRVGLFGQARVDASGRTGGGEILLGGDYQGQGEIHTATQTRVGPHARINADAIEAGDGGRAIVWADDITLFSGAATARAGTEYGDGGFIEISGSNLGFDGWVDASATNGAAGSVLFDPIDIRIQIASGLSVLAANTLLFTDNPGQLLTLAPVAITAITDTGTAVTLQADRDIIVDDTINTFAGGTSGDITFQAGRSILINADIITDNSKVSLFANDPGADFTNRGSGVAALSMAPGTRIDAGTGNIELTIDVGNGNGIAGDMTLESLKADHIALRLKAADAGGQVLQTGGSITALSVFIDHDGPVGGSIGSAAQPLNLIVDNLGAHIHAATAAGNGIFIDATPNSGATVTVGGSCYGLGIAPCDAFGAHIIQGLETINGGGIGFNVGGDLSIDVPIRVDDVQGTGNTGDIGISASGTITSNADIINATVGGRVDFNSPNAVLLTAGTYGGQVTNLSFNNGMPAIIGDVTFTNILLDASSSLSLISGNLVLSGDTVFNGAIGISGGVLDLSGATLTLNNSLTWSSASTIANGRLNLAAGSLLDVTGGAANTLDNLIVNIIGNAVYSGGNLTLANGTALNVNGVFDFAGNVGIADGGGAPSSFSSFNGATLVKSAGASSVVGSTLLSAHAGSVDVKTGNLDLNLALLDLGSGDVFSGAGNYIGDVTNNGGIIRPGAAGSIATLSVTGAFIHNAGTLEIDISAATSFDQLAVSSGTFTGGTIDVNLMAGHVPGVGEQQRIMLCGTPCVGAFANVTSPPGISYSQLLNLATNNLTLNVDSVGFAWDGGGDGVNWTDPLNWSLDAAPDNTIDVVLPGINVAINGAAFANNLTINGDLSLLGGGMLTTNNLTANPGSNLTLAGGTLVTNGVVQIDGAFNLDSGTLNLVAGGTLLNFNNNWRGGTITGAAPLVLGGLATTLTLSGAADKTLDSITLDMNLNDINASGSGNLVLANGATIDNTGGRSFTHSGNGDIVGNGTFVNSGGLFANLAGQTVIGPNVNFINDAASTVSIAAGTLVMQDSGAPVDLATYQIGAGAVFQVDANRSFGNGSSGVFDAAGAVYVSGTAAATMNLLSGEFVTNDLVVDSGATLAGNPVTVLQNFLWGGGTLASTRLTTAPGSTMVISGANATLPGPGATFINGNVALVNPAGTTLDLNGNLLQLNSKATLSGAGNIIGDVVNAAGVVVTGGAGNLGNLTITGNYTQGSNSALVVEVFNNGFTTVSDRLTVTGATRLSGGTLVIGFTTNSLGLVTADFSPLDPQGGVSGDFSRVFDAGGNIMLLDFNSGVFTVLGTTPKIPDGVIDDLIRFAENRKEFAREIASNRAEAETITEELLSNRDEQQGSLVCN